MVALALSLICIVTTVISPFVKGLQFFGLPITLTVTTFLNNLHLLFGVTIAYAVK